MSKFELVQETEPNGQVWYKINHNGNYVIGTLTRHLEEANKILDEFASGRQITPIIKVIKTIEVDETHKAD
jgi:hypothetical protein